MRDFAIQFTTKRRVILPEYFHLGHEMLTKEGSEYTEDDLNYFEEMSTIIDIYCWLGQKFETEFVEMDLCRIV